MRGFVALRAIGSVLDSYFSDLTVLWNRMEFSAVSRVEFMEDRNNRLEERVISSMTGTRRGVLSYTLLLRTGRNLNDVRGKRWTIDASNQRGSSELSSVIKFERVKELTQASWFRKPMDSGLPFLSGPYIESQEQSNYVITFALPLIRQGVPSGVLSMNLLVSEFERSTANVMQRCSPQSILVSADTRILCSRSGLFSAGEKLREIPAGWVINRVPSRWLEVGFVGPDE